MIKRLATMLLVALALLTNSCAKKAESQAIGQTLLFTWSGDDGMVGTASSYEVRVSTAAIAGTDTLSWWNAAPIRKTAPPPTPKVAGTPDSVTVLGLNSQTTYRAIMKVYDEVPNPSGYSNVAVFTTADIVRPDPPQNLRAAP